MNLVTWAGIAEQPISSELHPNVRYQLRRQLGEGGMGIAYYALRQSPDGVTPAVLKIVRPDVVANAGPTALLMVRKEAIALGRLNERVPPTPFVVRFLDTGTITLGGLRPVEVPWIAIEYVHGGPEGTTLEQRVEYSIQHTQLAFDSARTAHAIECLSEGLTAIHDVSVIHRDLTPGNVLCCGFGTNELFKIADFGIARPTGVTATFGNVALGTPGYSAPEQVFSSKDDAGPWTDVFSMACLVYFMLTGENYFDTDNMARAFLLVRDEKRRSIVDTKYLAPELRNSPAAIRAVDEALARATSMEPRERPQSAALLASSLLPALRQVNPRSQRASKRLVASVLNRSNRESMTGWAWTVRHPTGDDRIVRSIAWDGDAHCLAATTHGVSYWNGTDWISANHTGIENRHGLRFAGLIRPGRWLIAGENGFVAFLGAEGVVGKLTAPQDVTITQVSGDPDDLAVVVAERAGSPPLLFSVAARHFFRPLVVEQAAFITSLSRISEAQWIFTGRNPEGKGFAALYSALTFEVRFLPTPQTEALIGSAGQVDRGFALAAGRQGTTVLVEGDQSTARIVRERADLASCAIDIHGRAWVGGAGRIWTAYPGRESPWILAWADITWTLPLIALRADVGLVTAVTVDGGILEGREGS